MAEMEMTAWCNYCKKVTVHKCRPVTYQNGQPTATTFLCAESGHWKKLQEARKAKKKGKSTR